MSQGGRKIILAKNCSGTIRVIEIPHPKFEFNVQMGISYNEGKKSEFFEFNKSGHDRCGSWLLGNEVIEDGSFLIITPYDITFSLLKTLHNLQRKSAENPDGLFCQLDEIRQSIPKVILPHIENQMISFLCDERDLDGLKLYRLSDEKVVSWMSLKLENIITTISEDEKVKKAVDPSQQDFIVSLENVDVSEEAMRKRMIGEAIRYLGDYVDDYFVRLLCERNGVVDDIFPEVKKKIVPPPMKKKKKRKKKKKSSFDPKAMDDLELDDGKEEDITGKKRKRKSGGSDVDSPIKKKKRKKKNQKASSQGVKSLNKIDRDKMKLRTITSFFKKKK